MTSKLVYFFQPQYATLIDSTPHYWLPYSAACVWAYCQQFDDIKQHWQLGGLEYTRDSIDQVINSMDTPSLCAFSCYAWNEQYNLALAKEIKQRWPTCHIVFGGPQTGGNHIQHDFIDSIVFGEGEETFLEILRCLDQNQKPEQFYRKKRLENLDVPSPYLLGLFDDIISNASSDCFFQVILETNRGCPYACTYCDWGGLTYSKVKKFDLEKIEQELIWFKNNPVSVVFIADANFGIFKQRDFEIAQMVRRYLENSSVDFINMNYAKNSNETVFEIAKEFGNITKSITMSMQTMNPATLKAIKRDNMKSNDVKKMLELSKQYDIPTFTDMILVLPEETLESWCNGFCELLELGQHNHADIYIANVLENTELNQSQKLQYGIKTVVVENYQPFGINDPSGIKEYMELVSETRTMPRADMIDAFMYHWMMQNFHFAGYSQLLSKYCRYVLGIDYKKFYDSIMEKIKLDSGAIGQEYQTIRSMLTQLLETGYLGEDIEIHLFYSKSYYYFYQNIKDVIDLALTTSFEFGKIDQSVIKLQQRFMLNEIWKPNCNIVCNYNIDSWEKIQTEYQISNKISDFVPSSQKFQFARRSGALKNSIQSTIYKNG